MAILRPASPCPAEVLDWIAWYGEPDLPAEVRRLSCEIGKEVSTITAAVGNPSIPAIPAGGFYAVAIMPASGHWGGGGCYHRVRFRADSWHMVAESNEQNNKGFAHFCLSDQGCY